jgi:amino acid permease
MASYFGIVVFCYGICAFVFPIEENMEKKSQFGLAVIGCLVFVCSLYILVGNGCAILYHSQPEGISGNILLNLPAKSIAAKVARISMSGVIQINLYI